MSHKALFEPAALLKREDLEQEGSVMTRRRACYLFIESSGEKRRRYRRRYLVFGEEDGIHKMAAASILQSGRGWESFESGLP